MQNTSSLYKELVRQSGRIFCGKIICTFADGSTAEFTDKDIMLNSLKTLTSTSNDGSFDIGCAIIGELDFELDNSDGRFDNTSFDDAEFDVRIGLMTKQKYDGTTTVEWVRKGLYTAEEITVNERYIGIVAYDYLARFDTDFTSANVTFPITLSGLLAAVCTYCGVAYGSLNFPNKDYVVPTGEYIDESASCRDIISYIAQLACSFAYIDVTGHLQISWYRNTDTVITERQRLHGTVIVTGVQITDAADGETIYRIGTTDYCLVIDSNPLAIGDTVLQSNVWTSRLIGLHLTPFEADIMSDPSTECGDIVTISDLQGNTYQTPVTNIVYAIDNKMTVSCDAETVNEKKRSACSQYARVVAAASRETKRQISEYEVRAKMFSTLTANAMGYYQTEVLQNDGSTICYQHDKELLSESTVIWKKSIDSLAVSTDGGQTWMGLDSSGNAVLRVLAAEGIIADWIRAGTLEGVEIIAQTGRIAGWVIDGDILVSADGSLRIDSLHNVITTYDDNHNKMVSIDKNGIQLYKDGRYLGFIGTNFIVGTNKYGLVFCLDTEGDYMCWSSKDTAGSSTYNIKFYYDRNNGFVFNDDVSINGDLSVTGNIQCNTFGGYTLTRNTHTTSDGTVLKYWGWN